MKAKSSKKPLGKSGLVKVSPEAYMEVINYGVKRYEQGKKDFAKKVLEEYDKPIFKRKYRTLEAFVKKELSK